jgi:ribosome-binding protein aMBF1 (putative translation factor)
VRGVDTINPTREQLAERIARVMERVVCATCAHFAGTTLRGFKCTVAKRLRAVRPSDSCACHEFDAEHRGDELELNEVMADYERLCREARS